MNLYIDTCVLPRAQMQTAGIYRERFGPGLGFELLMMFDLQDFEENLKNNLELFAGGPLIFHEPVWGVEHSAEKGSAAWEEGMYHLRLTKKYADILHPASMVFHLNNAPVLPEKKDQMIRTALENLEEMQGMFPEVKLLVENTGTKVDGTLLLDQAEFTDLCRERKLPVLIDVGHANANGWDIQRLIRDLREQIGGFHLHNNDGIHDLHNRIQDGTLDFSELIPFMDEMTPEAPRVIEYSRPMFHGEPLLEDIAALQRISEAKKTAEPQGGKPENTRQELSLEQMQYVLRNMDDAVCLIGAGGELLYANGAAEKLFGIRADGKTRIWEAIPFESNNDALVQLFLDGVMENRKNLRSLVDYTNKNGEVFRLHVSLTCESEKDGVILIVVNDLTHMIKVHTAFARYTSPEIAEYVLTTREGEKQGGQEREVSVLISDVRGFTDMSTRLPSTELITVLNHYFESMAAVIRRFGGTIIEFLGDGIFAVFGAPSDFPDHASAAVSCAIEMQNAMAEVNAWNLEQGYPEFAIGIGISSGPAVVGNIGSAQKMKYGCVGETVNLAGRLEASSIGGQIYITENTKRVISEDLTVNAENTFMPKGGRQEIRIYSITGIGKRRFLKTADEPTAWKDLSPAKEVLFYQLEGKSVSRTSCPGRLTRISADEKYALLAADVRLEPLQDLMIQIDGQNAYAKILQREEEGSYRIGFTMKHGSLSDS